MAYDIGPRIGIDGEKEFKTALAAINSEMKNLKSEMDASVKSMSGMASEEDLVAKKTDILARSIEAGKSKIEVLQGQYDRSKEKLEQLAKALDDAKREFGENSEEALKAELAYNKQAKTVNDLGTQLNKAKAEVNEMTKEMADGAKDADKLDDELEDVSKSAEKAGDAGTKLGTVFKGAFFANIATQAINKLKDALVGISKGMISAAAEYSANMAAFEQIMGNYLDTANEKLKAVSKETGLYVGILRDDFTQATAKFKGLGYEIADATDLAARKTTLAADAAAFCDKSFEDASGSLNSFINGSYQGGEAIQLFANDAQMAAYAVEQGIVSTTAEWSKLDEATKQATRLEYAENLYEQSGALGQAAREAAEWNAVMMNLRGVWQDFLAKIGTPLLQALTPVIQNITEKLTDIIERIDWDAFTEKVANVLNFIIDHAKAVAAGLAIIAAGFIAVSIAASPLSLIALAVMAIVAATTAAIIGLQKLGEKLGAEGEEAEKWRDTHYKASQDVAQASIETSAAMGQAFGQMIETSKYGRDQITQASVETSTGMGQAFTGAADVVKGAFDDIKGVGQDMKDNLKEAARIIGDDFANMKTSVVNSVDKVKAKAAEMAENIKAKFQSAVDAIKALPQQVYQIGANIVTGLWNGIKDKFSWLVNQIKSFAHGVVEQLKGFFGIHSPSKVMRDEVGENIAIGIASGITAGIPAIKGAIGMVTDATLASGIMAPAPRVSAPDIERVGSGIVNGLNAGNSGGSVRIEVPLVINGREFARAVLSDFRAVDKASPEVVYG